LSSLINFFGVRADLHPSLILSFLVFFFGRFAILNPYFPFVLNLPFPRLVASNIAYKDRLPIVGNIGESMEGVLSFNPFCGLGAFPIQTGVFPINMRYIPY